MSLALLLAVKCSCSAAIKCLVRIDPWCCRRRVLAATPSNSPRYSKPSLAIAELRTTIVDVTHTGQRATQSIVCAGTAARRSLGRSQVDPPPTRLQQDGLRGGQCRHGHPDQQPSPPPNHTSTTCRARAPPWLRLCTLASPTLCSTFSPVRIA
jgi:hypothetical protein